MRIAELNVQPVLNIGNSLATLGTLSTIIADTTAGTTIIEEGKFSSTVITSFTLTSAGCVNKEAYISVAIQSTTLANDLGSVDFLIGNIRWDSLPFPVWR